MVRALDCGSRGPRFNPESRCHPTCHVKILAFVLVSAIVTVAGFADPAVTTGPSEGSLVIVGGGKMGDEIFDRFFELAGGREAPLVIIPTADAAKHYPQNWRVAAQFRERGATDVTVLHTRDRDEADSETFVAPLRRARAVWFSGGRQWRLVDAYAGTKTEAEIANVLKRGGVIGGTSAGATIQGSYLVRGAPEGNHIMMAPGHEEGFGYIKNCAIDQHLITRGREKDLVGVIRAHTELLGIGIDEGTAIVVHGDRFEVLGKSKVAVYSRELLDRPGDPPYEWLNPGDVFDVRSRSRVQGH